jgi:hypothetical protein
MLMKGNKRNITVKPPFKEYKDRRRYIYLSLEDSEVVLIFNVIMQVKRNLSSFV